MIVKHLNCSSIGAQRTWRRSDSTNNTTSFSSNSKLKGRHALLATGRGRFVTSGSGCVEVPSNAWVGQRNSSSFRPDRLTESCVCGIVDVIMHFLWRLTETVQIEANCANRKILVSSQFLPTSNWLGVVVSVWLLSLLTHFHEQWKWQKGKVFQVCFLQQTRETKTSLPVCGVRLLFRGMPRCAHALEPQWLKLPRCSSSLCARTPTSGQCWTTQGGTCPLSPHGSLHGGHSHPKNSATKHRRQKNFSCCCAFR